MCAKGCSSAVPQNYDKIEKQEGRRRRGGGGADDMYMKIAYSGAAGSSSLPLEGQREVVCFDRLSL